MMEIEAPSSGQKAEALRLKFVALAESGATEVEIISKLMAQGLSKEEADQLLPSILQASSIKRNRRRKARISVGIAITSAGFGTGLYMLIQGVFWVWPFLVGVAGIAYMTGYIQNFWERSDD